MNKSYTKQIAPSAWELKDNPKKTSIDFLLAYSKSLEVKKLTKNSSVFIQLN